MSLGFADTLFFLVVRPPLVLYIPPSLHNSCPRPLFFSEDDCQAVCPRRSKKHPVNQISDCHTDGTSTVWNPNLLSPFTWCQTSYPTQQLRRLEIICWNTHCNAGILQGDIHTLSSYGHLDLNTKTPDRSLLRKTEIAFNVQKWKILVIRSSVQTNQLARNLFILKSFLCPCFTLPPCLSIWMCLFPQFTPIPPFFHLWSFSKYLIISLTGPLSP